MQATLSAIGFHILLNAPLLFTVTIRSSKRGYKADYHKVHGHSSSLPNPNYRSGLHSHVRCDLSILRPFSAEIAIGFIHIILVHSLLYVEEIKLS